MIDISGIDKAELLAALVNNAGYQGQGWVFAVLGARISVEDARQALTTQQSFDYVG